jgi:hypothetical protein
MTKKEKPVTLEQYERMAGELEVMSASIRAQPEVDFDFADRLTILAAQMREDLFEDHAGAEGLNSAVKPLASN